MGNRKTSVTNLMTYAKAKSELLKYAQAKGLNFFETELEDKKLVSIIFSDKVVLNTMVETYPLNFKQVEECDCQGRKEPIKKAACVGKRKTAIPQREFSSK